MYFKKDKLVFSFSWRNSKGQYFVVKERFLRSLKFFCSCNVLQKLNLNLSWGASFHGHTSNSIVATIRDTVKDERYVMF